MAADEVAVWPVEDAVSIDGELDESAWQHAQSLTLDYQTYPQENTAPSVETRVLMMEDGANLYLAFVASDPKPKQIRAAYREHDAGWSDDWVGITLDTFGDQRRAFMFFTNPMGSQMDLVIDGVSNSATTDWNAKWQSAGKITDQGYQVEMAIPFNALQFPENREGQHWGFDLIRNYPRDVTERISVTERDRDNPCYLCQLPTMTGFADIKQGKSLEIVPYVMSGQSRQLDLNDGQETETTNTEVGVDVRWGITPSSALNLTINPDFSQVEADGAQLDVNNTFTLFFPELRPFFLDNADYFKTYTNLVYTRNIHAPSVGVKYTNKFADHTLGAIVVDDSQTSFVLPEYNSSSAQTLEQESLNGIFRYRKDYGANSNLGLLATLRYGDQYQNSVFGIDGKHMFGANNYVRYQVATSYTQNPDSLVQEQQLADSQQGTAIDLMYVHKSRDWLWYLVHRDFDQDFRADLGFVSQVDYDQQKAGIGHTWYAKADQFWNKIVLQGGWETSHRTDGIKLKQEQYVFTNMSGAMQSNLELGYRQGSEYYQGDTFDISDFYMSGSFIPLGGLRGKLRIGQGDKVDYSNQQQASAWQVTPELIFDYGRHIQFKAKADYQELDVDQGKVFDALSLDMRFTYQFNQQNQISFSTQQTRTDRNLELYHEPQDFDAKSKNINRQLLYTYTFDPQTKIYTGYNDGGYSDDLFPDFRRNSHAVFVKMSYGWEL